MKCPEIITRGMLTRKFREKAREPERGLFAPTGHLFARALGNDVSAGRRDFFGAVMGRRARRTARAPTRAPGSFPREDPRQLFASRGKTPPIPLQFGPPSRSSPSTDAARDPGTSTSAVAGPAASPSRRSPRLMNRRSSPAERTRR